MLLSSNENPLLRGEPCLWICPKNSWSLLHTLKYYEDYVLYSQVHFIQCLILSIVYSAILWLTFFFKKNVYWRWIVIISGTTSVVYGCLNHKVTFSQSSWGSFFYYDLRCAMRSFVMCHFYNDQVFKLMNHTRLRVFPFHRCKNSCQHSRNQLISVSVEKKLDTSKAIWIHYFRQQFCFRRWKLHDFSQQQIYLWMLNIKVLLRVLMNRS